MKIIAFFESIIIAISCFFGSIFNLPDKNVQALIENNGGKNSGSISAKTSFVLAGESMGPAKKEKAEQLGVPLVSEAQFLEMINEKPTDKTYELLLPF